MRLWKHVIISFGSMQQPLECCNGDASLCSATRHQLQQPLSCCPWCWREQKHQSRSPRSFSTRRGHGLKGEVPCVYLIQLGSQWGLPRDRAAEKGAAGLSNKDIQPKPLPRLNPPRYSAEWGSIAPNADLTQHHRDGCIRRLEKRKEIPKYPSYYFHSTDLVKQLYNLC